MMRTLWIGLLLGFGWVLPGHGDSVVEDYLERHFQMFPSAATVSKRWSSVSRNRMFGLVVLMSGSK